jgi:small subunit ribosomal protein S17
MTEDEKTPEETPEETPEASDASTAGPVTDDGPQPEAGDSPSAPPAEETAETTDESSDAPAEAEAEDAPAEEAPAEDAAAEAAPAEEAPAAAAEPEEDDLADLSPKERARILRSREPSEQRPQRSGSERDAERQERRRSIAAARSRRRKGEREERSGGEGTPVAERDPNAAKVRQGIVVSDKAEKTITVRIDVARRHPTYEKIVRRSRTLAAHDERNEAGEGDVVRIVETRPLSKSKRWRLIEVVEKAR